MDGLCSANVESHVASNFVGFVADVNKEADCKAACSNEASGTCHFYTYHGMSDEFNPGSCFLLSNILEPVLPCEKCRTGLQSCPRDGCFFLTENGTTTKERVITTSSTLPAFFHGTCELNALAVGWGGSKITVNGGGGSGYVSWKTFNASLGESVFEVTVGVGGGNSMVMANNSVLIEGQAGGEGDETSGGDGYSGGAADCNCVGGSNGEDGSGSGSAIGGTGSDVDVASISVGTFVLR